MVIRVGNDRVYRFSANSTVICEIHDGYAEVLVLPERRRFRVSPETAVRVWSEYGNIKDTRERLSRYLTHALREGVLTVDEEVAS